MIELTRANLRKYRKAILASSETLENETAIDVPMLFSRWAAGIELVAQTRICGDDEKLYTVLQSHTAQEDWKPSETPSLFARVLIPDPEVIYDWEQPDSTNAYKLGDKVRHNGKIWESLIDGNVWEPGAVGTEALWKEIN